MTPKELELLMEKAQAGDAEAQYELGKKYYDGEDVEKDGSKAFYWAQLSAAQNSPKGQNLLGVCYRSGTGVEKDEKKAVEWYTKATEQGYARAQCNLGVCYEYGRGVKKDEKKAFEWYTKAAEQGYARAQCYLGECYKNGMGVEKDEKKAVEWYTKAAEQKYRLAYERLGELYAKGLGVQRSRQQAIEWYSNVDIVTLEIFFLAWNFYYGDDEIEKDYAEAEFWFKYLLDNDKEFTLAYSYLGLIYKEGGYGVERNLPEAVKYFALAAEAGRVKGQIELAACYEYGMGVERDLQKALEWYIKAAEKNDEAKVTLEEFRLRHTVELERQYSFANAGKNMTCLFRGITTTSSLRTTL